jgi:voltage-gated potassium channel
MDKWRRKLLALEDVNIVTHGFWTAVVALGMLIVVAICYYMAFEPFFNDHKYHWSFVDSLYMVMVIVTTIGLQEIHPLSQVGRVFTTIFAFTSLFVLFLVLGSATKLFVLEQLGERAEKMRRSKLLKEIRDHYIVCGYGRMGRETVTQLLRRGNKVVVIEHNPDMLPFIQQAKVLYVEGNATEDEVLREAGIERARGLISASDTDEDNLFIVLSARLLNPNLFIVARASQESSIDKLQRAGADRVHSPYVVGGKYLANAAVAPGVVDFLETVMHQEDTDLEIAAIHVPEGSKVAGKAIAQSQVLHEEGAMILAIVEPAGHVHSNPRPETVLKPKDNLIVMGSRAQLAEMHKLVVGHERK